MPLSLSTLLPFVLFAFVASITPGPTNILVLNNSARHGLRAAPPIILGAALAAAGIVLLVGAGLGDWLAGRPKVQQAMQWLGLLWLSYLAWQIWQAPASALDASAGQPRRLGLAGAAALQLVNPKTWMMALAVVSVFAGTEADRQWRALWLSLVFFLIALPCLGAWALLGAGSARWLRSPQALKAFNRGMALLLLASTWMSLWA
ncbi:MULTISPECIES: LysE family translocator [Pseudomonas]|jgi:threonine/homoserine/homoserine lactone efflux protein|uniref:Transporter, LysE family n=1 Tax=Pseudomonas protegens (strain DSM 19095 / LMG 27888 / CFBP 6595 / CHA0) TaxID=1124983 RepID=A0A2C9ELM4_PSEPH|nr:MULTISPECIES: LysE family translocator [Pseudomonas]AGL84556.1 transporter, LysE family [Pseudomonas protegens CHA0]MBP5113291.1 LysE family translocator [Pseudomonas protegens]MCS4259492.1 threonine/homoserine/homoserine lactone efflux protein [Pseudomonas sp. BIGb0176]MDK1399195.1 LysE family translocator [Pseudomonas protegens]MDX9682171.1 LysE family translocator [Pseudomonas protegens]